MTVARSTRSSAGPGCGSTTHVPCANTTHDLPSPRMIRRHTPANSCSDMAQIMAYADSRCHPVRLSHVDGPTPSLTRRITEALMSGDTYLDWLRTLAGRG